MRKTRINSFVILLIILNIIYINSFIFDTINRYIVNDKKYFSFFCAFFKIYINVFKRFLNEFVIINNRNRKRIQQLFFIIYKRVERFLKRFKTNFLLSQSSFF